MNTASALESDGSVLAWIDLQRDQMIGTVARWAGINSGSYNLPGLSTIRVQLMDDFAVLGAEALAVDLLPVSSINERGETVLTPFGKAIHLRKRPDAPLQIFLGIHMDTVYGPADSFQTVTRVDDKTLRGPGVIDAKGGLAVMLMALEALERSGSASRIGWEVVINPDEEIGSPGSAGLFAQCASRNHFGLVFEPSLPDGSLVSRRKGSGNFSVVIRGKSAHAGRDFSAGRNAVVAAADFSLMASRLIGALPDVTVNIGKIEGGGPVNVVPDLAIVRLNARILAPSQQANVESELRRIAQEISSRHQVSAEVHGSFLSPPKVLDDKTRDLCRCIESCGAQLEIPIHWRTSGGASDGNKLAAAGLPVIDTMGPIGGNLHSPEEYLMVDSLTQRARLCALLLLRFARGDWTWPVAGDLL
jgi:glutamate carboxypeptidase